jgi:hypothetical protein
VTNSSPAPLVRSESQTHDRRLQQAHALTIAPPKPYQIQIITRNMGQDGGHDKKLRNKMASDNARNSIGI